MFRNLRAVFNLCARISADGETGVCVPISVKIGDYDLGRVFLLMLFNVGPFEKIGSFDFTNSVDVSFFP